MYTVYNLILMCLTVVLSPLIGIILAVRRKYRCGFFEKCGMLPARVVEACEENPPIWVHAVSVGEVMAAVPLLKEMKKRLPGIPILLSTVTETGHQTAHRNAKVADHILFFPFDYPFIVNRVVEKISPRAFITLETEIWPNFLRALSKQSIPSIIVSGRISSSSYKSYTSFGFFFKKVLAHIHSFCMQTDTDAQRIIGIGAAPERVTVSGNIKFDQQVPPITEKEKADIYKRLHISPDQKILIAGSTHRGEEEIVLDVFQSLKKKHPDLVLILAPRHPERFAEAEELLKQYGCNYIKKTALQAGTPETTRDIILLDTIGELSKIYSIGTVIVIGGSLVPGIGGHNVLEPAVFSKPVLFGANMSNFAEIAAILTGQGGAVQVTDKEEFITTALNLFDDPGRGRDIGATAFKAIEDNSGAVNRCMGVIEPLLKSNQAFEASKR